MITAEKQSEYYITISERQMVGLKKHELQMQRFTGQKKKI